ncbi:hypothetical protein Pmani_018070 [Petrolisthes manimaculis]|uniref:COMM domain-containing protein n=1 Tax=Petrolisthes manimaculis TaxID=1843537 RepID=A0AAE1PKH7_9EUCA|nr:hypothetical protein Pmani_018070 [Petrolisthes manimaculis]
MLNLTKRLESGLQLANRTDVVKMKGVVSRVCVTLTAGRSQVFTEEEEDKLSVSLGLSSDEMHQLVTTTLHILHQAAQGTVRPGVLEEHLVVAGLTQDRAEVFGQLWAMHARSILTTLRNQSLAQYQLEDMQWSLQLETATRTRARQARPLALLQLSLSTPGGSTEKENVAVQMDRQQLFQLYQQLEQVQGQLDSLR